MNSLAVIFHASTIPDISYVRGGGEGGGNEDEIIIEVNETNCLEFVAVLNGENFASALDEIMSLQFLSFQKATLLFMISVPDYKISPF